MGARVSVATWSLEQVPMRAFPYGFTSSDVEAMKWVGGVAMVIAHFGQYVAHLPTGWHAEVGRIAFPLFALAYALSMAKDFSARALTSARSLLPFAVIAQIVAQPMRDPVYLNVLFLFLSASAWLAAADMPGVLERRVVRVMALCVAALAEFSLPGLWLLVALVHWLQSATRRGTVALAASVVSVAVTQGSPALLLSIPCLFAIKASEWQVPRVRGFFPIFYVGHFVVLALLRRL